MSVWVTIPSARPVEQVQAWAAAWRERGYKIAVWRDDGMLQFVDMCMTTNQPYPGYASAVNSLIAQASAMHADAEWFVIGGDDVYPDENYTAEEISVQCAAHFGGTMPLPGVDRNPIFRTFGVMQPTGDRFGETSNPLPGALKGAYADRVCGSAWLGREFCRRVNQGRGPLWPEYFHMGVDEELQEIALRLGILWQRRDVTQFHKHWTRREGQAPAVEPEFLKDKNSPEAWQAYKKLFATRKAAGFPGSELIP